MQNAQHDGPECPKCGTIWNTVAEAIACRDAHRCGDCDEPITGKVFITDAGRHLCSPCADAFSKKMEAARTLATCPHGRTDECAACDDPSDAETEEK